MIGVTVAGVLSGNNDPVCTLILCQQARNSINEEVKSRPNSTSVTELDLKILCIRDCYLENQLLK
jgi:hypothetical protein